LPKSVFAERRITEIVWRRVPSCPAFPIPDMTYNVFGGTLYLTLSICLKQKTSYDRTWCDINRVQWARLRRNQFKSGITWPLRDTWP